MSHFKSAEAKLSAALKGLNALRMLKKIGFERVNYEEMAVAMGLKTEHESWKEAVAKHVMQQVPEALDLIRAIQIDTGEDVLVHLVVKTRTGEPGSGFHTRNVQLIDLAERE
jgi:hypothetical protein